MFYKHIEVQLFVDVHYNERGEEIKHLFEVYLQRHRQVVRPSDIGLPSCSLWDWEELWGDDNSAVLNKDQLELLKFTLNLKDRDERPIPAWFVL